MTFAPQSILSSAFGGRLSPFQNKRPEMDRQPVRWIEKETDLVTGDGSQQGGKHKEDADLHLASTAACCFPSLGPRWRLISIGRGDSLYTVCSAVFAPTEIMCSANGENFLKNTTTLFTTSALWFHFGAFTSAVMRRCVQGQTRGLADALETSDHGDESPRTSALLRWPRIHRMPIE